MKLGQIGVILLFIASSAYAETEETEVADASAAEQDAESSVAMGVSESSAVIPEEEAETPGRFALDYTNIFYGPSLQNPSSLQPDSDGNPDPGRPIYMKNFLSLGYAVTENVAVTGTAYWLYQPVQGQQFTMQDPSVRVSHGSLVSTDWGLNLYSDFRVHFGVSSPSRDQDLLTSLQNFNILSWNVANGPLTLAVRSSARSYIYGSQGEGWDMELYVAPEINYQLSDSFALTLLYEMGADHWFRDTWDNFQNSGTDLQPGFAWNITPSLLVNPYVTLFTGNKVSLATTSVGMFMNWTIL